MKIVVFWLGMGLMLATCGNCSPTVRRLKTEVATLRAQLDTENNVREAVLRTCIKEKTALEVECVADRVMMGEIEYCPAFEACYQDCLTSESVNECDQEPAGD
jgi:hypothetical protein